MDFLDLSNPILLVVGGIVLLLVLYMWNKQNTKTIRKRRQRNFRKNYYDKKNKGTQDNI
tara:strand:- start:68397 stop:68573 length:177 start_codon:yes stop_codon:yes gene_type:complete